MLAAILAIRGAVAPPPLIYYLQTFEWELGAEEAGALPFRRVAELNSEVGVYISAIHFGSCCYDKFEPFGSSPAQSLAHAGCGAGQAGEPCLRLNDFHTVRPRSRR